MALLLPPDAKRFSTIAWRVNQRISQTPRVQHAAKSIPGLWTLISTGELRFHQYGKPINLSSNAQRNGSLNLHSTTTGSVSNVSHDRLAMPGVGILKTPIHLPTRVNYNRQLAWNAWTTSEAVFYTIQVMSAACLLDTMPQLRETLPSLREQAATAIDQGISQVLTSQPPIVPADLVFTVFALGTSLHWTTHAVLEHPWLEAARNLHSIWRERILSSVGRGSIAAKVDRLRGQYKARFQKVLHVQDNNCDSLCNDTLPYYADQALLGTRPNSWCGVSNEVVDVFGQVLAFCRTGLVTYSLRAICGQSCWRWISARSSSWKRHKGFPVQTRDDNTPIFHLLQTAEVYPQAALLQLHVTFSGLFMIPEERHGDFIITDALPNDEIGDTVVNEQSRTEFLLTLALQLVAILEQIPADSGSKSIHHMLYVSAAAVLRFDTCAVPQGDHMAGAPQEVASLSCVPALEPSVLQMQQPLRDAAWPVLALPENPYQGTPASSSCTPGTFIPQSVLEVSKARRLIWALLSSLQHILPHRASGSILRRLKAIWLEYNTRQPGWPSVSWFNVLRETGSEMMLW
ncbi:hypothetical protein BDV27DRAFT_160811 [Aspergillus caelatus]|uniref:Fungal-specific transcription factor domain-containing protein n=1 Tax=Aspergillus caelatus TaxID=61420 RepID=A0A5N6ZVE1_9EURO|nr:uncharacterized protein BDV27DRAFT_160811 [Aspergillus caelatus]KAE8361348.1 hypothetical protein BDV27DRAFT_160811 [Aspergillus caelatus]